MGLVDHCGAGRPRNGKKTETVDVDAAADEAADDDTAVLQLRTATRQLIKLSTMTLLHYYILRYYYTKCACKHVNDNLDCHFADSEMATMDHLGSNLIKGVRAKYSKSISKFSHQR